MLASRQITSFRPDPFALAAYGALFLGGVAGFALGAAVTLQFGPPLTEIVAAPEVCALPFDPIGDLIREDAATRL